MLKYVNFCFWIQESLRQLVWLSEPLKVTRVVILHSRAIHKYKLSHLQEKEL